MFLRPKRFRAGDAGKVKSMWQRMIMSIALFMSLISLPLLLGGCGGNSFQSMFHPAGPKAAGIETVTWVLFGLCSIIFLIAMILLATALLRGLWRNARKPGPGNRFIVLWGAFVPALILTAILFISLGATRGLRAPTALLGKPLTIHVIGHQWWWEVRYPEYSIVTANEIHIPVGRTVEFKLESADVVHSFWVPSLHGKMDLIPGQTTTLQLSAGRAGVYRGQCAEYCGIQHALMAFMVVALEPGQFEQWLQQRQKPTSPPATASLIRGRRVFFEAACNSCHAIKGTPANGKRGPDLTHIGSRLTLGAATVSNTHGNLAGWIADPQGIKPGNKMPPSYLSPDDLHALREYLESLK